MISKVLVTDKILGGLTAQAAKEKLLSVGTDDEAPKNDLRRWRSIQDALSLIILFDKIVLPVPFQEVVDIPVLSDAGALQLVECDFSPDSDSDMDPIVQTLQAYHSVRPLVLNKLMKIRKTDAAGADFDFLLASEAGVSRRTVYDAIIHYAIAFYGRDRKSMQDNLLWRFFPPDLRKELVDGPLKKRSIEFVTDRVMRVVTEAVFATGLINSYLAVSRKLGTDIATGDYGGPAIGWSRPDIVTHNSEATMKCFFLTRCAIHEDGRYFPKIEGIRHALRLRSDANLSAFKRQLRQFHVYLKLGDRDAVIRLRKEVATAKAALERSGRWNCSLRWVTYLTLPASVVETIVCGVPVLSSCMSLYALGGTVAQEWVSRKHGWVMFGST